MNIIEYSACNNITLYVIHIVISRYPSQEYGLLDSIFQQYSSGNKYTRLPLHLSSSKWWLTLCTRKWSTLLDYFNIYIKSFLLITIYMKTKLSVFLYDIIWIAMRFYRDSLLTLVFSLVFWAQIAKFMGPTWGPPGSCRPQMGPMLAPWTLLSGTFQCLCMLGFCSQCQ